MPQSGGPWEVESLGHKFSGEVAQWTSSANREVGGSNLRARVISCYAALGLLSRMYKKLCMRVK